jgi:hypothetical protein
MRSLVYTFTRTSQFFTVRSHSLLPHHIGRYCHILGCLLVKPILMQFWLDVTVKGQLYQRTRHGISPPIPSACAWGSVVVKALRYWADGLRIDSRWCHWGIFPYLPTEPCAVGLTQPLKISTKDGVKAARCIGLTTYQPCSVERQENPGP